MPHPLNHCLVGLLSALFLSLAPSCGLERPVNALPGEPAAGENKKNGPLIEEPAVVLSPRLPAPGDFTLLAVGPCPANTGVRLEFEEAALPITASPAYQAGEYIYLVLGIGFPVPPGIHRLTLSLETSDGQSGEARGVLEVEAGDFQTFSFSMPAEKTSGWSARELAAGRERVRQARLGSERHPLWNQPFILPLQGPVSSGYGEIRIINGAPPSYHTGIDLSVAEGTPVRAINDGVVRLAATLPAHGNIVIIDHGLNLSSSYMHMATITVQEGRKIARGEVIGTVGSTGYSTGPHLHWEVNLGTAPVNPGQLARGDLFYLPIPR
ncbi:MAG: M23 family metallopeptidase [Bacillota bacterium]